MEQNSPANKTILPGVSARQFVLIDDDHINNMICQLVIELTLGKVPTQSFTDPASGLEYIQDYQSKDDRPKSILLLDINMPQISGWQFLEQFDNLPASTKEYFEIYILSSSVDERDKQRSYANKNVKEFLVKPITKEIVRRIFDST